MGGAAESKAAAGSRILVIHGAMRRGNTLRVTEVVQRRMQDQGDVTLEEIWLQDLGLEYCQSCYSCFMRGEEYCPHADTVLPLVEKLAAADGFVLTSPCFSLQVPGHVKAWLDHMSYCFHRPCFFTKKAMVISTTAGQGADAITKYLQDVLMHWGVNRVHRLGIACRSLKYEPDAKAVARIERVADAFLADVQGKVLRAPSLKRVAYYNVWRAMAYAGRAEGSRDYTYWEETGLSQLPYSPDVPWGAGRRAFGSGMYWLMRRVIR